MLLVLAACTTPQDEPPARPELPEYHLDVAPVLTISDDGSPDRSFSGVSAMRLTSGDIVVSDQGSSSIRIFGRDGNVRLTVAKGGNGPGEIHGRFALKVVHDTILALGVPPSGTRQVQVYGPDGRYLTRIPPLSDSSGAMTAIDRLSTGEYLVERGSLIRVLSEKDLSRELSADSTWLGLCAPVRTRCERFVWLPERRRTWSFTFPWVMGRLTRLMADYPFAPNTFIAAAADRVWIANAETGALTAVDGRGRRLVDTRLTLPPQPFQRRALDQRRAGEMSEARRGLDSARIERMYSLELPRHMPLVSAVYPGADGEIWVRQFSVDDSAPANLVQVDRLGRPVAFIQIPAGVAVQQIGNDFVLAVRQEDDGTESILEFGLKRR